MMTSKSLSAYFRIPASDGLTGARCGKSKRKSWIEQLVLVLMLTWIQIAYATTSSILAKPGVWHGAIGEYPVILCIENEKIAYYYPGQSTDIKLMAQGGEWIESTDGRTTGHWSINKQTAGNVNPNRLDGEWRKTGGKPRGKRVERIELWFLGDAPSACSSSEYRQALLSDDDSRLSLPLPQAGQVAAADRTAAVVMPNGELWMWSEVQRQPKLIGKGYLRVAVGMYHTVAIKTDGSLWGWGSNLSGQLGGENIPDDRPIRMGEGFVDVAANHDFSLAIRKDGTLWSWGGAQRSAKGELLETRKPKPRLIGKSFVSVSAGDASFAALKNDGTLWMWGRDHDGQLGIGNRGSWLHGMYQDEPLPAWVGKDFASVSAGYAHTAAVTKDGALWTWGVWGALGNGSENQRSRTPVKLGGGYLLAVAGFSNSAALKTDGSLWLWGDNQLGMFGDCTTATHNKPEQVGSGFVQAALGQDFLVALKLDGSVWTWGWPWDGDQMDTPRACRKPAKVVFADGVNAWDKPAGEPIRMTLAEPVESNRIASIAAGKSHSAMVTTDGRLWTWGSNGYGQLATGDTDYRKQPKQSGSEYAAVFTDANHTLALKKDGSFWRWGAIPSQYPHGDFLKSKEAALAAVKIFPGTIRLLHSGYHMGRALGLGNDGAILDWGYYADTGKQPTAFGRDVREIAAGGFGNFAIRRDGTLWKLDQSPINLPRKQIGQNFAHIVSAKDHAYGIKTDGSLWAWGENYKHQLGDATTTARADPIKIGSGFVQVSSGQFHGIALAADGSVWTWGDNETGAIGDGSITARAAPVKIGSGFVKVAAGNYHNLALKADGSLWAWGNNEDGQLGDGTNNRRLAPVQIFPAVPGRNTVTPTTVKHSSVTSVRTSLYSSCAFFQDGSAKCWGSNSEGQLGNDNRRDLNPKPIAVENKEQVLNRLASFENRKLDCTTAGAKACNRIKAKYPFLQGAKMIVNDSRLFCALMKNGTIRCSYGEGFDSEQFVVDGVHGAIQFDYYDGHGCALQADGRVKCWGDNTHGELGNGTTVTNYHSYRSVAVEVVGL